MNEHSSNRKGLEASVAQLVRCRPNRKATGFAPGGKVRTHQFGRNRSVFHGRGMEFNEVRAYQPGDDIRAIDWRVTARTGSMHTKLFQEERARPVLLLVDLRSGMQFGTRVQFKSALAAGIGARLAWTAIDGGDRLGGVVSTPTRTRTFPVRGTRSATLTFLKAMAEATRLHPDAQPEEPLAVTIDRLRQVSRPGALVFIVSDFADYDEQTERAIRRLALHAHVTNILIYDQLETLLPASNDCRVSDGSGVVSLGAVKKTTLQAHARRFDKRRQRIATLSQQHGMGFLAVATHDDANAVLRLHQHSVANERRVRRMSA